MGTTDSSVDQQHRTTFCAFKHACSSYEPAILMDSGFLVDDSSGVFGKEDWALAVGGGRVRGRGSKSSNSMWGEGLEEVEKLQRERDGRDSLIGTTDSSVDQQHRTTFCALKHARSSNKPAISMDSGCLVDASSGVLRKEDWALAVGGGRARGTESNSSGMWREGLEEVEELQREARRQGLSHRYYR